MKHRKKSFILHIRYLYFILTILFIPGRITTQYYISLGDNTGYDVAQYYNTLNAAAQELVESFPAEYQDSFRVYSTGFYVHAGDFDGGYPLAFQQAVTKAAAQSKYYLLIGRESDEMGLYRRFWVELALPSEDIFNCLNSAKKEMERIRCSETMNEGLPLLSVSQYINHEKKGMGVLMQAIESLKICCDPENRIICEECPDTDLILSMLLDMGFIGIPVNSVSGGTPVQTFSNVTDYSGKKVKGVSLAAYATSVIHEVINPNDLPAMAYITDNLSICLDSTFDIAMGLYEENYNYDIWIHLWESPNTSDTFLFVKADFYILYDDPDFLNYYDENVSTLKEEPEVRVQEDSTLFLIYDPELDQHYLSYSIQALPWDYLGGAIAFPEHPKHIVKQGETLSGIAVLHGNNFTVYDLVNWNPGKLSDISTQLQIGWELLLYNEEYLDLWINEYDIYGITIPVLALKDYNLITVNHIPRNGLIPGPGAPPITDFERTLKRPMKTIKIPKELEYPDPKLKEIIKKPATWERLKRFGTDTGVRIAVNIGRAGSVIGLLFIDAGVGNYVSEIPMGLWTPMYQKTKNEEDEQKLTYVTYTKYKRDEDETNIDLPPGKVYIGRTSGYDKYPIALIKKRDMGNNHHKSSQNYAKACYDDHEYSRTNSRQNRHSDDTYRIIRGREQVVIDAVGGSWHSKKPLSNAHTRSGNAINGIDKAKYPQFYQLCAGLSKAKGEPPIPPISWKPYPCNILYTYD